MKMQLPNEIQEIVAHDDSLKRKRSLRVLLPFTGFFKWGFWGIVFLMLMSINGRLGKLQTKEAPALVQMADGSGIPVKAESSTYRSPVVINEFVKDYLAMALNWSNKLTTPDGKEEKDKGLMVNAVIYPTGVVVASYLMEENFGQQWLASIAQDKRNPVTSYMDTQRRRFIMPKFISEPIEIKPGVYSVDVIAAWYDIKPQDNSGVILPYKKTFILQAVQRTIDIPSGLSDAFTKAIYRAAGKGLQVQEIRPFQPRN